MGGEPDAEEEGQQGGAEARPVHPGSGRRAQSHIGEVPQRVGRVQERPVVAPPAGSKGVEGWTSDRFVLSRHRLRPQLSPFAPPAFVPQITTPPPRLISRARASGMPAARHISNWSASGYRR